MEALSPKFVVYNFFPIDLQYPATYLITNNFDQPSLGLL